MNTTMIKLEIIDLAKETNNVDLILGGHTHTFLEQPTIILNKQNKEVVINQTGWRGVKLGRINIAFDDQKISSKLTYQGLL